MNCKICNATVWLPKNYEIIHEHDICVKCIEKYDVNNIDLETLNNIIPDRIEETNDFDMTSALFIGLGLISFFMILLPFMSNSYYDDELIFQSFYRAIVLIGIGIILKRLGRLKQQ